MATDIDHGAGRRAALAGRPLVFQRGDRARALKAGRRRRALRAGHVLALTALLAGFFLAVDRVYLFLITWDRLTVRTVELRCDREPLRRDLERFLKERPLGNLLLCDISTLRRELRTHAWVREASVQKVFPSTLKIEVAERVPFALLERNGRALVDREANILEAAASAASPEWMLPVIRDEGGFRDRFPDKWESARAALEALTESERTRLLVLECSSDGRLTLEFRDDPVRLIMDCSAVHDGAVRARLDRFAACRAELEGRFGPLDYADLRLDDRIVVRPLGTAAGAPPANSQKEAE
jgi:cell division septal protein FtsQ